MPCIDTFPAKDSDFSYKNKAENQITSVKKKKTWKSAILTKLKHNIQEVIVFSDFRPSVISDVNIFHYSSLLLMIQKVIFSVINNFCRKIMILDLLRLIRIIFEVLFNITWIVINLKISCTHVFFFLFNDVGFWGTEF